MMNRDAHVGFCGMAGLVAASVSDGPDGGWQMAGGVLAGHFSHIALDAAPARSLPLLEMGGI